MPRKKMKIDEELVAQLAGLNCSQEEIARIVGCAVSTLKRRCDLALKRGADYVKTSLKKKQFDTAMNGNVVMLIWLGKNILGQSDKIETKGETKLIVERRIKKYCEDEQRAKEEEAVAEGTHRRKRKR
jgi:hypothetical protein